MSTPTRVAYFGESLGAAVAVRLALESPPAALVLRSPFTSLAAVGRVHYPFLPVQWLLRDRWASLERIAQVTSPLAGHRRRPRQRRAARTEPPVVRRGEGPKTLVIVRGADHNDADLVAGPQVIEATLRLLTADRDRARQRRYVVLDTGRFRAERAPASSRSTWWSSARAPPARGLHPRGKARPARRARRAQGAD